MIIAGTCQHESFETSKYVAQTCKEICDKYNVDYIFKASFDKANRSKASSPRGLGLEQTLEDFVELKNQIPGLKFTTDVHECYQVELVEKYNIIDVYQIPAMLCRQTDLIKTASQTNKIVNIKKGQFMSPYDCLDIITKATEAKDVWLTERGSSFGYNRLVVDFVGLNHMLTTLPCQIIFDVTHAIQNPGSVETSNADSIIPLAKAGKAVGVENFFFEVHPWPAIALSDGPNSLHLDKFESLVSILFDK